MRSPQRSDQRARLLLKAGLSFRDEAQVLVDSSDRRQSPLFECTRLLVEAIERLLDRGELGLRQGQERRGRPLECVAGERLQLIVPLSLGALDEGQLLRGRAEPRTVARDLAAGPEPQGDHAAGGSYCESE